VNGKFSFVGIRKFPEHFAIEYIAPGSKRKFESFKFFIEPTAKVNITLFPDSISKSLITGSKIASDFFKVNQVIEIGKNENGGKLKTEYEKFLSSKDTILKRMISQKQDSLHKELLKWKLNYIQNNPKSYISAYLINSFYHSANIETVQRCYNLLDKSILDSRYSKQVAYFLSSAPGNRFQDFELPDSDNKLHRFSEISKGKVVLIDFWATWCKACRQQTPRLLVIYNSYKSKGFEVVGISGDKDTATFRSTILKDNMTWINLIDRTDENSVKKMMYTPSRLPSNVLIDRNGIITHKDIKISELEEAIRNLLK
jgi:peroxiredoxin